MDLPIPFALAVTLDSQFLATLASLVFRFLCDFPQCFSTWLIPLVLDIKSYPLSLGKISQHIPTPLTPTGWASPQVPTSASTFMLSFVCLFLSLDFKCLEDKD